MFVSLKTTGKTHQLVQLVLVGKFGLTVWKSLSSPTSNKLVAWQLDPVTAEVTYGLERLASYIQEVDSVYDIEWAPGVKYGEIFLQPEYEHSKYSFEVSDQDMLLENFEKFEKEAGRALELGLVHPAYDYVLKCSHTFNLLDARGAVSVTERAGYIARIRNLARVVAKTFVAERKKLGYPLLDEATRAKLLAEEEE